MLIKKKLQNGSALKYLNLTLVSAMYKYLTRTSVVSVTPRTRMVTRRTMRTRSLPATVTFRNHRVKGVLVRET